MEFPLSSNVLQLYILYKNTDIQETTNILYTEKDLLVVFGQTDKLVAYLFKHSEKNISVIDVSHRKDLSNIYRAKKYNKYILMDIVENKDLLDKIHSIAVFVGTFKDYLDICHSQFSGQFNTKTVTKMHQTDKRISSNDMMQSSVYDKLSLFFNRIFPMVWVKDQNISYVRWEMVENKYSVPQTMNRYIRTQDAKRVERLKTKDNGWGLYLKKTNSMIAAHLATHNNGLLKTVYQPVTGSYTSPIRFALGHINNEDNKDLLASFMSSRKSNVKLTVSSKLIIKEGETSLTINEDGSYDMRGALDTTAYIARIGSMTLSPSLAIYASYLVYGIASYQAMTAE